MIEKYFSRHVGRKQALQWIIRAMFFGLFLDVGDGIYAHTISIQSTQQQVSADGCFLCSGDVHATFDNSLKILTDQLSYNYHESCITARAIERPVFCESNEISLLADALLFKLPSYTGSAQNIVMQVGQGYVKASGLSRTQQDRCDLKDVVYTACDCENPHWVIAADRATLYGGYLLYLRNLSFRWCSVPIFWLPVLAVPLQKTSKSGFLPPHFSYDGQYGFGIRQEYYCYFHRHADAICSLHWRDSRCLILSHHIRWARSPYNYTICEGYCGTTKELYQYSQGVEHAYRYWLCACDSERSNYADYAWLRLMRLDIGTDKQVGYKFFNKFDALDNRFYSGALLRLSTDDFQISVGCDGLRTKWDEFGDGDCCGEESCHRFFTARTPYVIYADAYRNFASSLFLKQVVMVDGASLLSMSEQRSHAVNKEQKIITAHTESFCQAFRGEYRGCCLWRSRFSAGNIMLYYEPRLYLRNYFHENIDGKRLLSASLQHGIRAEFQLPSCHLSGERYDFFTQCFLYGNYRHGGTKKRLLFDRWDYDGATQLCGCSWESTIDFDSGAHIFCGTTVGSAHGARASFYEACDHWVPSTVDLHVMCGALSWSWYQAYDVSAMRRLISEVSCSLRVQQSFVSVGYLVHEHGVGDDNPLMARFYDGIIVHSSLHVAQSCMIEYDAQWYRSDRGGTVTPVFQRISCFYEGHCWSGSVGFEQRCYRDHGISRTENLFVFSFQLDTLGKFTKKVRRFI